MDRIVNLNDERNKLVITIEDRTFEIARMTLAAQNMISNWMRKSIEAYHAAQEGADELRSFDVKEGDDIEELKAKLRKRVEISRAKLEKHSIELHELENATIKKVLSDNGIEYDDAFWTEGVDASIPAAFLRKVYSKDTDNSTQKKT